MPVTFESITLDAVKRRLSLCAALLVVLAILGGIFLQPTEFTSKTLQSLKGYSRISIQPMITFFQAAMVKVDHFQGVFCKFWDLWWVDSSSYHFPSARPPDELRMFLSHELPIREELRQITQLLSEKQWEKSLTLIQQEELAQPGNKALLQNLKHFALLSLAQNLLQTGQNPYHAYILLESILKVNPGHVDTQRTLSEMYFMVGKELQDGIPVRLGPSHFYEKQGIVQPGSTYLVDRKIPASNSWMPIRLKDDGDNLGWIHKRHIKMLKTFDRDSKVTIKRIQNRRESEELFIKAKQLNPSEDMNVRVFVAEYGHYFLPLVITISIVLLLLSIFLRNLRKVA